MADILLASAAGGLIRVTATVEDTGQRRITAITVLNRTAFSALASVRVRTDQTGPASAVDVVDAVLIPTGETPITRPLPGGRFRAVQSDGEWVAPFELTLSVMPG